jgi:glycerol-3-phosphate O-acyltransferase
MGHHLYFRGFKHQRFAAGANLTKLPWVGSRFRGFGAFTVEREIAFERNYVKNLCNKVVTMMAEREAVVVFPEGGRSYSGSMLEVKNGILGAAVLMQAQLPGEDVFVLPMAISYECPPDVPWFDLLLAGKKFRRRTQPFFKRVLGSIFYFGADILAFAPFLFAPKLGRRYGAVYIDYDAPLAIRSVIDIEANRTPGCRGDAFFEHRASMQKLADVIQQRFCALYRMLPMHLLAFLLRNACTLPESEAALRLSPLLEALRGAGRNMKSLDLFPSPSAMVAEGQRQLLRLKAIAVKNGSMAVRKKTIVGYCAAPVIDVIKP